MINYNSVFVLFEFCQITETRQVVEKEIRRNKTTTKCINIIYIYMIETESNSTR